jgi:hypothetical protein
MTKKQLNSFLGKEKLRYDDADQTRSRFVDVCGALCGATTGTSRESGIVASGICGENRVESKDGIELGSRALRSSTRTVSGDCICIKNVNPKLNAERVAELFTQNLSKNLLTFTQIWGKLYSVESDGAFPKICNRPEAAPRSHRASASSRAFFLAASARLTRGKGDAQDGS